MPFLKKAKRNVVVHIVQDLDSELSGPSYSVTALAKSMGRRNEAFHLVFCSTSLEDRKILGKKVVVKCTKTQMGSSRILLLYLMLHCRFNIKLISINGSYYWGSLFIPLIASLFLTPMIFAPRGTIFSEALRQSSGRYPLKILQLYWLRLFKFRVHATSREELVLARRVLRREGFYIPIGMDHVGGSSTRQNQIFSFIFLGRLHPIKNLEESFIQWKYFYENCLFSRKCYPRFIIAGDGEASYIDKLRFFIAQNDIPEVYLIGAVKGCEKIQLLRSCQCLVLPSLSENFGVVVTEALSVGLPVIASEGTPWELLNVYQAGCWGPVYKFESFFSKIYQLTDGDWSIMSRNASRLLVERFSWESLGRGMEEEYDKTINPNDYKE